MYTLYINANIFNGYFIEFLDIVVIISFVAAIFTIISKNPIVSVLNLILLFGNISLYLITIGIVFIGISYLLVYVGAVSILFLFILMLINIRISELINDTNNSIPLAIVAITILFIPFSSILPYNENFRFSFSTNVKDTQDLFYVSSNDWDGNIINFSDIASIGNIMYTNYSLWLIVTSVILLLAMVGSIIITIKQEKFPYFSHKN